MTKSDHDQARRFEEMARKVGADGSAEEFEREFGRILPPKRRPQKDAPTGKRKT